MGASQLISDVVDGTGLNGWDYDNIGNRLMEHRSDGYEVYTSNELNQYTAVTEPGGTFTPAYDLDGNQTRIKTSTGIRLATYKAPEGPEGDWTNREARLPRRGEQAMGCLRVSPPSPLPRARSPYKKTTHGTPTAGISPRTSARVYGQAGYIRTAYTYTAYGTVTADGDVRQPIQWSSEYNDTELGLVYYIYRHRDRITLVPEHTLIHGNMRCIKIL